MKVLLSRPLSLCNACCPVFWRTSRFWPVLPTMDLTLVRWLALGRLRRVRCGRGTEPWPSCNNSQPVGCWTHDTQLHRQDHLDGRNLDIMRGMNSESVDLIYLDPPFNSNRNYANPVGSQAAGAGIQGTLGRSRTWMWPGSSSTASSMPTSSPPPSAREVSYDPSTCKQQVSPTVGCSPTCASMGVRLVEMKRVLKDTGSITSTATRRPAIT